MAEAANLNGVLAEMRERECPDGKPWCPPKTYNKLETDIRYHGEWLGSGMKQLVRIVRVAALCTKSAPKQYDYNSFFYTETLCPRSENFKKSISNHNKMLSTSGIQTDEKGIVFTEDNYNISYGQMVKAAIFLDFLYNVMGYKTLPEYFKPVTKPDQHTTVPAQTMDDIAKELRSKLNVFLTEAFGTQHDQRKKSAVRTYLQKCVPEEEKQGSSHAILSPEKIDDETIFQFWKKQASNHAAGQAVEGFKYFTSSARSVFAYRQALFDAQTERDMKYSQSIETGQKDGSALNIKTIEDSDPLPYFDWSNPLLTLTAPPVNTVTWLTNTNIKKMKHYLGNPLAAHKNEPKEGQDIKRPEKCYGLMGDRPYDLNFVLTLLRADIFDPVQQKFRTAGKAGILPVEAIHEAVSRLPKEGYQIQKEEYADLHDKIKTTNLATVHVLILKDVFSKDQVPEDKVQEAKAAFTRVNRAGFRDKDMDDPDSADIFKEAGTPLVSLSEEVKKLDELLEKSSTLIALFPEDQEKFLEVFELLYTDRAMA